MRAVDKALVGSLGLHRVLRELHQTLPNDTRLACESTDAIAAIKGAVEVLGADVLQRTATVFALHDLNGDGVLSPREIMKMKTELRSLLPDRCAPAVVMPADGKLDFVDFCQRASAQNAAAMATGTIRMQNCVVEHGKRLRS